MSLKKAPRDCIHTCLRNAKLPSCLSGWSGRSGAPPQWKSTHWAKLDLHIVVLLLHPINLCTDALKTITGFANSAYNYSVISFQRKH